MLAQLRRLNNQSIDVQAGDIGKRRCAADNDAGPVDATRLLGCQFERHGVTWLVPTTDGALLPSDVRCGRSQGGSLPRHKRHSPLRRYSASGAPGAMLPQ